MFKCVIPYDLFTLSKQIRGDLLTLPAVCAPYGYALFGFPGGSRQDFCAAIAKHAESGSGANIVLKLARTQAVETWMSFIPAT